jgi:hypothetical protein
MALSMEQRRDHLIAAMVEAHRLYLSVRLQLEQSVDHRIAAMPAVHPSRYPALLQPPL